MDVVDESSAQKLLDRSNATPDPNVFSVCGCRSAPQGGTNPFSHEMERSVPRHREGGARVVGQHKYRSMERRMITPPTLPGFVRPGPSHRPKHVATHDPCSNIIETPGNEIIVNTCCPAVVPNQMLEGASRDHPIVQGHAANAERVLEALTWTSTVSIDGNPKSLDSEFSHERDVKLRVFAIREQSNDKCVACI